MSRFEKWSVLLTAIATTITGVGYMWIKYLMEPSEPWAVINHPLQPWLLKAHILVSPLLVFAIGMIAVRHVWQHMRRRIRWGRRSGLATALVIAPMVVTGYLIQSVTHTGWLQVLAWTHIVTGLVFAAGLAAHVAALKSPPEHARDARKPSTVRRRGQVVRQGRLEAPREPYVQGPSTLD